MNKTSGIILFLLEGGSEVKALMNQFEKLYDRMKNKAEIYHSLMKDSQQNGGDITSKYGISPKNIKKLIDKLFIEPFLDNNGFRPKDINEIIHIVDIDGVFIPDKAIIKDLNVKKTVYKTNNILTKNVDLIIERNEQKRENLNILCAPNEIKIQNRIIKYSIYYFCSNLDHFLYKNANLTASSKLQMAQKFFNAYNDTEKFISFFQSDLDNSEQNYKESWEWLKEGLNSLQRHTNLNLLIDKITNN